MKPLLSILALLFLYSACKKPSCFREYEFHFPATITQGDTFAIGDTLWVTMDLPTEQLDHQTGETVNLREFELYFSANIERMDTAYTNHASSDFELLEDIGTFRQGSSGSFSVTTAHFNNFEDRQLRLGLVPQKKGVYVIALSLPLEMRLAGQSLDPAEQIQGISNHCRVSLSRYSGTRFEGGCYNYYLLAEHNCQQASATDPLWICLDDSTTLAKQGVHGFVVR